MVSDLTSQVRGRCLCGAVKFSASAKPLFVAHCHCSYCRLAHGAAFVTWLGVPEEEFNFDAGKDALSWFASSKESQRGFCSQCGTTLFFTSLLSPGEMHIARANVTSEVSEKPFAHLFIEHQVDWLDISDGLPQHTGDEVGLDKYKAVTPISQRPDLS